MGAKRPLLIGLAISLLGHIAFVLLFPGSESQRRTARFDVVLVAQQPAPVPPAVPARPEPEARSPASTQTETLDTEPALAPEPDREDSPEDAVADEIADSAEVSVPLPALNLSRPPGWDELISEIPVRPGKLTFNPSLNHAVRQRNTEKQRSALVAARHSATYGVADDDYERTGVLGREIKRKGGCATLVEDKGVEEGQRWWASQCTETRQNPFTLPAIEIRRARTRRSRLNGLPISCL